MMWQRIHNVTARRSGLFNLLQTMTVMMHWVFIEKLPKSCARSLGLCHFAVFCGGINDAFMANTSAYQGIILRPFKYYLEIFTVLY